jgi:hypothetical protein
VAFRRSAPVLGRKPLSGAIMFRQGQGAMSYRATIAKISRQKGLAMLAFLKSELFFRFLGGFAIGAVAMFALQPNNEPPALTSTAIASTATPVGSAAL